jgi:hypothetical protein
MTDGTDVPLPGAIRVTIDYALKHHDDGRVTVQDPDGYSKICDSIDEAVAEVRAIITAAYSSGRFHVETIQQQPQQLQ